MTKKILSFNNAHLKKLARSAGAKFGPRMQYVIGEAVSDRPSTNNFDSYAYEMIGERIGELNDIIWELSEGNMRDPANLWRALSASTLKRTYVAVLESLGFVTYEDGKRVLDKAHRGVVCALENPNNHDIFVKINSERHEIYRKHQLGKLKGRIEREAQRLYSLGFDNWNALSQDKFRGISYGFT